MINLKKKLRVKWEPGDINKVFIDLPQGLGDQIMCFPLLASLKAYNRDMNITVMTFNTASGNLLSYNKNIDSVKVFEMDFTLKGLIKFFRLNFHKLYTLFKTEKYDLFIITHPNPLRNLLYFMLPAKRKIYNRENIHKFFEVAKILDYLKIPVIRDYSVDFDYTCDLLTKFNLKEKNYILLDIYAQYLGEDPRQWPYFNDLIFSLKKITGKHIVVAGINENHNEFPEVVDLVNRTNFKELLYLIKNASVVVSMDTFYFHMSYCLKTPVVALFGPVNPEDRMPYGEGFVYKTIYKNLNCSPCIRNKVRIKCDNNYNCMKSITVDEVISAVREFL